MADEKNLPMDEEEVEIYTLTDEETGEETDFELLASNVVDGVTYIALAPCDEDSDEYGLVILKSVMVKGEEMLSTLDSEEEAEKVYELFMEQLMEDEE
jgi:uncharacterized protein YrzB (UPF0473 family)